MPRLRSLVIALVLLATSCAAAAAEPPVSYARSTATGHEWSALADAVDGQHQWYTAVGRQIDEAAFFDGLARSAAAAAVQPPRSRPAAAPATPAEEPSAAPAGMPCGGDLPPCWVLDRESGYNDGDPYTYDIHAYNPTGCGGRGCRGKWQCDPRSCSGTGTEAQQDAEARRLWNGGEGCGNWGACS